jgi:biotin transport system substrate-specific component
MSHSFALPVKVEGIKESVSSYLQVIAGSILIALCARIEIPLPFTPVPLTCQTLAILFLGATLGSKKGAACALLYLLEVVFGLPVLAGGVSNSLAFFGPRCGYLLGMPLQAYIAGKLIENKRFSSFRTGLCLTAACAVQLGLGLCGLVGFVGAENVLMMGLFPFIPGELLKVLVVTNYLKARQQ